MDKEYSISIELSGLTEEQHNKFMDMTLDIKRDAEAKGMKTKINKTKLPLPMKEILDEVTDINPYKQPGNRESYSKYNEGWADACYTIEKKIKSNL